MMRFLKYAIPSVVLIAFYFVLQMGWFLKSVAGYEKDFTNSLSTVKFAVEKENWNSASKEFERLEKIWENFEEQIRWTISLDEVQNFSIHLKRLEGAIEFKESSLAQMELIEIQTRWESIV